MINAYRSIELINFIMSLDPTNFYHHWLKDSTKYIVALTLGDYSRYDHQLCYWHFKLVDNIYRQLTGL